VLSACGPALAGTMVADYWMVRKGRPENVRIEEGFSSAGIVALACGVVVGMVTGGTFSHVPALMFFDFPFFVGPVNGIVVAAGAYVIAYRLTGKTRFTGRIAWTRPMG